MLYKVNEAVYTTREYAGKLEWFAKKIVREWKVKIAGNGKNLEKNNLE